MKRRIKPGIILLCLLTLLFSGCAKEDGKIPIGSNVWETPQLAYGVWESEKLQVLSWNSGRCEATSFDTMAETPLGYYTVNGEPLYYADKAETLKFVPVCNKPNCAHDGNLKCNASVGPIRKFVIQNDRIYYLIMSGMLPQFDSGDFLEQRSVQVVSMAPDGTDRQLAYALTLPAHSRVLMFMLSSEQMLCNVVTLNQDGTNTAYAYRVTAVGEELLATSDTTNSDVTIEDTSWVPLWGDRIYLHSVLDETLTTYFRFSQDAAERIDLNGLTVTGSYLSGTTLRFFRTNDGYYDRNIQTGEEVKLADARLRDSMASIVLPNCVIESTLFTDAFEGPHAMEVFDGEAWHTVQLPNELKYTENTASFSVKAVTSDRIIFTVHTGDIGNAGQLIQTLYSLSLAQDSWEVESYASLGQ